MKTARKRRCAGLATLLIVGAWGSQANAQILTNGGFESGFTGWTRADQVGGDGTFAIQTGLVSPVNGFAVPAPPQGIRAAMTDSGGPGSHILYQNFVVPVSVGSATISFSLFINSGDIFVTKSNLNFGETNTAGVQNLNQQVRVDILRGTVFDPFSTVVSNTDVLLNLFQTTSASPLVSGYNSIQTNVTSLFQANAGQTLRIRFAEVDNIAPLNAGVDAVSVTVAPAPEPSSLLLAGSGALAAFGLTRRRRRIIPS